MAFPSVLFTSSSLAVLHGFTGFFMIAFMVAILY